LGVDASSTSSGVGLRSRVTAEKILAISPGTPSPAESAAPAAVREAEGLAHFDIFDREEADGGLGLPTPGTWTSSSQATIFAVAGS
jgi:hypothetical protein